MLHIINKSPLTRLSGQLWVAQRETSCLSKMRFNAGRLPRSIGKIREAMGRFKICSAT